MRTTLKTTFHDKAGIKTSLEINFETMPEKTRFSISGRRAGAYGQIDFEPANVYQKQLKEVWKNYHIKNKPLPHNLEEHTKGLINCINFEEQKEYKEPRTIEELMKENDLWDTYDIEACEAYLELFGETNLDDFVEKYVGTFNSDIEFAKEMAESTGAVDEEASWPNNCIDWEKASNQLMQDYDELNGAYFRAY